MKKILYGTTALVAAGMISGAAQAAEPIDLSISGHWTGAFAFVDDDNRSAGTENIKQEGEIQFSGETTLDNGLTFGVNVQLEATSSFDQIDEHYLYVESGLGRINLGAENGAAFLMHYTAPYFVSSHGVDSPTFRHISRTSTRTSTYLNLSGDANKLTYFTPRMGGFQFGISYTPDTNTNIGSPVAPGGPGLGFAGAVGAAPAQGTSDNFGVRNDSNLGLEQIVEVGGNWIGNLFGYDLAFSLAYASGDNEGCSTAIVNGVPACAALAPGIPGAASDPEAYSFGGSIVRGGWELGGAYYTDEDVVAPGAEQWAYAVGVAYTQGPWTVGGGYFEAETDAHTAVFRAGCAFGGVAPGQECHGDMFEFGAQYNMGPGVDLALDLAFTTDEIPAAAAGIGGIGAQEVDSTSLAFVIDLSF